ncbi:arylphorin subunit alpha [Neodiprion lecontei]|uniref:Arylphorin subunit alpha n=1 Tax=Neodiprion lecontei TaxID=441921 RepID=A0A6J0BEN4_NEOLC|nr:arylphorin subunit alpha [Neodiprion lecontei]
MSGYIVILLWSVLSLGMADHVPVHLADEHFVTKQKSVYDLLQHLDCVDVGNPGLYREGASWDVRGNLKAYDSEVIVNDFLDKYERGMLPRGRVFSVFYPVILDEAIALFRLFRSAVDFKTFYKTAAWARIHVNEGQFVYAFSVAVIHRPDTKYVKLPAPYEINPDLFFNTEIIRQAQLRKLNCLPGSAGSHVILANRSLWYAGNHDDREHEIDYFVEDVGLNAYYQILNLEFPFWMSSEEFNLPKGYRGELYYHNLKLILTRYNLERISNNLDKIEYIDWNKPIETGYHPSMTYHNGLHFPRRDHNSMVPRNKYKKLQDMQNLESRILEAIDSGFVLNADGKSESIYTSDGFDILGNIIEGNVDSLNKQLYGSINSLARNILGFSPDPLSNHQILPSALEHFSTSLRDPGFYRICNRIVEFFNRYKSNLEPYTAEELGQSAGLKIESVVIDKLETYFDHYDSVIESSDDFSFTVKARQRRLNHKPFSYAIRVHSEMDTEAMVRIFLGPKYDALHNELAITENYENFYEFDAWKIKLEPGWNDIKRTSNNALFVVPDDEGIEVFYRKLKAAAEEKAPLTYSEHVYGFPDRLLLPKGKKEGLRLQVFVHVVPCSKDHIQEIDSPIWGKAYTDGHPMGFPLDRPIQANNFTLPNMRFEEVVIFHREAAEINATV